MLPGDKGRDLHKLQGMCPIEGLIAEMWAQCDPTFQFLKKSQLSQFLCEISPLLMFTINAHRACLSTHRRHRGKLAGEDGHQGAVPSSAGPKNDGTEEMKSQLKQVVKVTCFPIRPSPPGWQGVLGTRAWSTVKEKIQRDRNGAKIWDHIAEMFQ